MTVPKQECGEAGITLQSEESPIPPSVKNSVIFFFSILVNIHHLQFE